MNFVKGLEETRDLISKMNPSQIDLFTAAFGANCSGSANNTSSNINYNSGTIASNVNNHGEYSSMGDDTNAFAQMICKKIQASIEKKALNKGLGLNEDGTVAANVNMNVKKDSKDKKQ